MKGQASSCDAASVRRWGSCGIRTRRGSALSRRCPCSEQLYSEVYPTMRPSGMRATTGIFPPRSKAAISPPGSSTSLMGYLSPYTPVKKAPTRRAYPWHGVENTYSENLFDHSFPFAADCWVRAKIFCAEDNLFNNVSFGIAPWMKSQGKISSRPRSRST